MSGLGLEKEVIISRAQSLNVSHPLKIPDRANNEIWEEIPFNLTRKGNGTGSMLRLRVYGDDSTMQAVIKDFCDTLDNPGHLGHVVKLSSYQHTAVVFWDYAELLLS